MNELALFAGAGGGILGGHLLGWRTVAAVEIEDYPRRVLLQRQSDGLLPRFPIWDDIRTFDGKPWAGKVDVISGGFPCQDISAAGKGDGLDGERSGMWKEMARVVGEVRPSYVFVENSPMLTTRGGVRVIGDLTQMGYDCKWTVMGAADIGAPHQRDRIWIVAHSRYWSRRDKRITEGRQNSQGQRTAHSNQISRPGEQPTSLAHTMFNRLQGVRQDGTTQGQIRLCRGEGCNQIQDLWGTADYWATEPAIPRVANGVASRVDRLKAIGNGQVPLCAATAWRILK